MAILATALGIAVLVTILSIMNGFEGELRGRILGMAAHLTVATDTLSAEDFARQLDDIRQLGAVRAAAPFLERDVLIQSNGVVRPVVVRGIDIKQEERVTELHSHIVDGKASMLESGSYGVLIGHELAQHLALTVGDKLTLLSPRPRATPAGLLPVMKRFTVAGIFEFGLQEHDAGLVVIDRSDAARLFRSPVVADGIRVRLHDPSTLSANKARIASTSGLPTTDWSDTHRNLYRALKTEKIVMFVILGLAIAIAAFNLVAILVVSVGQKRGDIAMLKALGLSGHRITRLFFYQGGVMAFCGVTAGLLFGALLACYIDSIVAFVEHSFGFKIFSPEVYYITSIPSEPRLADFVITAAVATLIALLSPIYPARLAAQQNASEGLKHE